MRVGRWSISLTFSKVIASPRKRSIRFVRPCIASVLQAVEPVFYVPSHTRSQCDKNTSGLRCDLKEVKSLKIVISEIYSHHSEFWRRIIPELRMGIGGGVMVFRFNQVYTLSRFDLPRQSTANLQCQILCGPPPCRCV